MTLNTKTNEEHATEFLNTVGTSLRKHKTHLNTLKKKFGCRVAFDADDVLHDSLIKCYETIQRNGIKEVEAPNGQVGTFYDAYFNLALTRAFKNYSEKRKSDKNLPFSLDYMFEQDEHDEPNAAAPALHAALVRTSEAADFTEFDTDGNEAEEAHYAAIQASFDALPDKYKELLQMEMSGLKYKEMCRVLGLTMGQVKMRMKAARDIIKAQHTKYPKSID